MVEYVLVSKLYDACLLFSVIPFPVIAPIYDKDMPRHVVMAKLGNVLAQGIGRNFDHTGKH